MNLNLGYVDSPGVLETGYTGAYTGGLAISSAPATAEPDVSFTVFGTGLTGATAIYGGEVASVTVVDDTELTVTIVQNNLPFGTHSLVITVGADTASVDIELTGQYIDVVDPANSNPNAASYQATPAVETGDQFQWRFVAPITALTFNPDTTIASLNAPGSFEGRFWDASDETWGAWQTLEAIYSQAETTVSYTPGTGRQVVDLTSWSGDAEFTGTPGAADQIEGPDTLTINADGTMDGPYDSYLIRHIDSETGDIEAISYEIVPLSSATTVVAYQPPSGMTLTPLEEPIEPYIFESWASLPVADEQLLSTTSEGVFDVNGNWVGDAEGVFDYWFVDLDGQTYHHLIDTSQLEEAVETYTFAVSEGISFQELIDRIKIGDHSVTEAAETTDDLEAKKVLGFDITELAEVQYQQASLKVAIQEINEAMNADAQISLFEIRSFSIQEMTYAGADVVILPLNYLTPVVTLPTTDLNAGHDTNYQTPEIQLYQGSWHKLIVPVHIGGQDITKINKARMQLFRGPEPVLTLTLSDRIKFENSTLYIELDESDTVNLIQGYQYELWVMDLQSNPLFVRSGKIVFKPTQLRF